MKGFIYAFRKAFIFAGGITIFLHPLISFKRIRRIGIRRGAIFFISMCFNELRLINKVTSDRRTNSPGGDPKRNKFFVRVVNAPARINLITDSVQVGSLFGGVATSIILANEIANKFGMGLRLVTRQQVSRVSNVKALLANTGNSPVESLEYQHMPEESNDVLTVSSNDFFVTTSWWTTRDVLQSVPARKIIYILQEDERIFYEAGDLYIEAQTIMNHPSINVLVNTRSLRNYLIQSGVEGLSLTSLSFEPSFEHISSGDVSHSHKVKRDLFFYARPNHARNLYRLGLKTLTNSVEKGILDPAKWNFHFVGFPENEHFPNTSILPIFHTPSDLVTYKELIGIMDVGLSLMSSPHPSYPVIDLAAAGKMVVTNDFFGKMNLSEKVSDRIIQVPATVESLTLGLQEAINRIDKLTLSTPSKIESPYCQTWIENLKSPLENLKLKLDL